MLDGKHTVFGHVIVGQDVVNQIAGDDSIRKVVILRKGKEAEAFNAPVVFESETKGFESKKQAKINAMFTGAKTTASGLRYTVQQEGTGKSPKATDTVKVHYTGKFLDGKVFDSSVQRGQPIEFPLNQVIPGWTEGLQLMKEGGKSTFYIPYQLGYGEQGYPGAIPPKSDLIFEVELIKVK